MNNNDIKILEENGWSVECHSPFEIRHNSSESFASGLAAEMILNELKSVIKPTVLEIIHEIPQQHEAKYSVVRQIFELKIAAHRLGLNEAYNYLDTNFN